MAKRFIKLTVKPTFSMSPDVKQRYELVEYANGDVYIKLSGINDDGDQLSYKNRVSKSVIEEIRQLLSETMITVHADDHTMCDGYLITLEIDGFLGKATKISLSWISEPPDGWQNLSLITDKIFNLIPEE